ncbi:MAG: hypothetical protein AB7S38_38820 [Vulcanimicrobiota bacterium]
MSELPDSSLLRLRLTALMLAQDAELSALREQFRVLCSLEPDSLAKHNFPWLIETLQKFHPQVDWLAETPPGTWRSLCAKKRPR